MSVERAPAGTPELELPSDLAILPVREAVLYPGMLLPMQLSEPHWVQLLSDAASARQPIGLFLQRGAESPAPEAVELSDLAPVGTAASMVRLLKLPDGALQVLLQGMARISAETITQHTPYPRATVRVLESSDAPASSVEAEAEVKNLLSLFQRLVQLSPNLP
ncbi:MAG: LON peptidase substrate-binding domain-containing protein, partial [Chloroflexi bacterium]|nr:LON peptidase substrate-binding domain-containing protein [Chloroflexota bacterium]